jgi:hypothetical protein
MNKAVTFTRLFLLIMTFAAMGVAQTPAELRGVVADEFGAIIRKASISLDDGNGRKSTASIRTRDLEIESFLAISVVASVR